MTPSKSMTLADLKANPKAVTEAAMRETIAIVDENGTVRFHLSIPGDDLPCLECDCAKCDSLRTSLASLRSELEAARRERDEVRLAVWKDTPSHLLAVRKSHLAAVEAERDAAIARAEKAEQEDRLTKAPHAMSKRCQALDADGHRCRRNATTTQDIHGEPEFRDVQWNWVRVNLCAKHDLSPKKKGRSR